LGEVDYYSVYLPAKLTTTTLTSALFVSSACIIYNLNTTLSTPIRSSNQRHSFLTGPQHEEEAKDTEEKPESHDLYNELPIPLFEALLAVLTGELAIAHHSKRPFTTFKAAAGVWLAWKR
jgi:hypothetical protein